MMAELEERAVLWVRGVPERDAPTSSLSLWLESTRRGAALRGGSVELTLGLTLVLSFDALDLEAAVECAQKILQIGKEQDPAMAVHIGLALGEVGKSERDGSAVFVGAAFDRAQLLSQRARPYEVVFDEAAEQRGDELWLFAREIWSDRVRGYVLEPVHWSKRACRSALAQLRPAPLTKSAVPVFDQLHKRSQEPGQQRVALHAGARASALDLLERLVELSPPSLLLCVSESAGSLSPLGSLSLAIRRIWPTATALHAAGLPPEIEPCLQALASGAAVQRTDLVEGLSGLLRAHAHEHARAFIVLEELPEIDPASLAVLAEVLMEPDLDALVLMTLPLDASVPAQLMPAGQLHELYLPPLPAEDRITIAEAALSLAPGSEIAQRVALLGGAQLQGLLEAIRTLVSSGDLIWSGEHFSWRLGPRQGAATVPIEALLTERVVGLPPGAYRVLEVACSCPILAPAALLEEVAAHDGVSTDEFHAGLAQLQREGLTPVPVPLGGSDAVLRGVMRNLIPPARAAELHRYAAQSLRVHMPDPCFGSGEIAYHLLESGQVPAAAQALVEAAHCAMDTGFQRMALRLLATAVEWDPSTQIRKAARALARVVSPSTSEPKINISEVPQTDEEYEELKSEELGQPLSMAKTAMRSALDALGQRDFDAAERWLDSALAAGADRAAAQRVLSLSHVMRGDLENAIAALQRSQTANLPLSAHARETLCWAIVRLAAGDANDAIRTALVALAAVRDLSDTRGEAAVLRVLSIAYRSLERDEDALQLEAAALTRLRGFVPLSHPA
jgi:tetratricopeptide (TPR) repeat protein